MLGDSDEVSCVVCLRSENFETECPAKFGTT